MNKLKVLLFIIISVLAIYSSSALAANMILEYDGGIYEYNGSVYDLIVRNKKVESALDPIIFNDRALVPVRDVFEEVGATVNYRNEDQTIEIIDDDAYVRLKINDNIAYVNGEKTVIPDSVVPKLISKLGEETKTMVPVRFISESIGLDVEFDSENGAILIESNDEADTIDIIPTIEPTPNITPAPSPIPTPLYTAQPTPTPTKTPVLITDITYQNVETGKIAVTVTLSEPSYYTYFTLTDPERLVVDIPNAKFVSGEETIYVNNGGIKAIRVGVDSERTRVVIDMDKMVNYGFGKDGNNIIIYAKSTMAVSTPSPSPTPSPSNSIYNKNLIAIDAGHGGYDPGAQGTLNGQTVNESDINLQITFKVKEILESKGYSVLLTRSDDTYKTLTERPDLANKQGAALFVSIHINSVDNAPTAHGTEVYYAESNNETTHNVTSNILAQNILECMLESMGSYNRGVKTAEHAVTKRSEMPACLVEVGFITNPEEVANMTNSDYQYKTAQGIVNGIIKTLNQMN